jgi:hypothetical protein
VGRYSSRVDLVERPGRDREILPAKLLENNSATKDTQSMFRNLSVFIALTALCLPQYSFAWGEDGHTAINRVAAMKIPASMPDFFRHAADRLAYLGPEPDRWRNKAESSLKYSQEPDHFIDMERTTGIGELPIGRYDYIQKLYAYRTGVRKDADLYLPDKVGFQPYIVAEVYGRLKVAFRDYRKLKAAGQRTDAVEQDAIFYAGWLGHYVADGSNPLHTTINYNGWTGPNPNGYTTSDKVHWQFEGLFVHENLAKLDFASLVNPPTAPLADEWKDYLTYLHDSNALVEKVYQLEKTGAFTGAGTPDGTQFVKQRLAAGAQMLVTIWLTAWEESAKPAPDPFS